MYDRYGWCRAANIAILTLKRIYHQHTKIFEELEDALKITLGKKEVKEFTIAFCEAMKIYDRLPRESIIEELLGRPYLGACLDHIIVDCQKNGIKCFVNAQGLHFAD